MSDQKPPLPPWVKLMRLTPIEAWKWFRGKHLKPSFRWGEVWDKEHANAFTIAGMMSVDLLATVHQKMSDAIENGQTLAQFEKDLTLILVTAGWWGRKPITDERTGEVRDAQLGSPARIRLIYETNMRAALAAGTWEAAQRTKDFMPHFMYRTMRDERVRPLHKAWDGLVLPIDHPFWRTHFPPNAWGCRCRAFQVDDELVEKYRRAGFNIKTTAPEIKMKLWERDGQRIEVPVGIDPGFAYNPGLARAEHLADIERSKLGTWPKPLAEEYLRRKTP